MYRKSQFEREREKSARKRNGEIMCAKMVTCRLCSSAADDASCLPPERHIHWMCDDVQRSLFVASPECIRWMFNRIEVPMAGYRCANEITRRTFDAAHSSNRSWCLFGKHPVQWTLLHRRLSYSKTSRDLRRLVSPLYLYIVQQLFLFENLGKSSINLGPCRRMLFTARRTLLFANL